AIAARPERWLGRLARRIRRRPIFSAAVAAGTLAAVALAGGGLWLISERAAAAREVEAERAATERAADEDLREMGRGLNGSSWPEARAARERARGRPGYRGAAGGRRGAGGGGGRAGLRRVGGAAPPAGPGCPRPGPGRPAGSDLSGSDARVHETSRRST